MTAITKAFNRVRRQGRSGFIPYITAGDPDLAGARVIEIAGTPNARLEQLEAAVFSTR